MAQLALFHKIAGLQLFDGSFNLDSGFAQTLSLNLSAVKTECSQKGWNEKAWATTLALAYFHIRLPGLSDDWELIADKSKIWLVGGHAAAADAMFDAAEGFISK